MCLCEIEKMKKREDKKAEREREWERWRGSEGQGQEDRGECLRCPDLTHSVLASKLPSSAAPLLHRMKIVRSQRVVRHCF